MKAVIQVPELPHGDELRFIERIIAFEQDHLRCAVRHPLPEAVRGPRVPSWWGVEIAAQAAGILLALKNNGSTQGVDGRLVQIRSIRLSGSTLPVAARLEVSTELKSSASFGLNLFDCRIRLAETDEEVLKAMLNLLVMAS
ncbi:MAG: hypothetical protein ACLFUF_05265 [Opitutales bacterium]